MFGRTLVCPNWLYSLRPLPWEIIAADCFLQSSLDEAFPGKKKKTNSDSIQVTTIGVFPRNSEMGHVVKMLCGWDFFRSFKPSLRPRWLLARWFSRPPGSMVDREVGLDQDNMLQAAVLTKVQRMFLNKHSSSCKALINSQSSKNVRLLPVFLFLFWRKILVEVLSPPFWKFRGGADSQEVILKTSSVGKGGFIKAQEQHRWAERTDWGS